MAYKELIKKFSRTRDYMREFYLYGFKSRDEYNKKSARSYDDERRRIESWLGEYMQFRQSAEGKNMFISIDSRTMGTNPLFKAWKTCSFTDKDITLHFTLLDILAGAPDGHSLKDICDGIDEYLSHFSQPLTFDESTVRKKLKEYRHSGIVRTKKQGKTTLYFLNEDNRTINPDALAFFSEAAPCGVIGSFIADQKETESDIFAFKHHYITQTMDSGILTTLFCAIADRRRVLMHNHSPRTENDVTVSAVPLKIYISTQNGRQYVLVYHLEFRRIMSYRLDYITDVTPGDVYPHFEKRMAFLEQLEKHMWGVSATKYPEQTCHVEFTVAFSENEGYIYHRLQREKRCGTVELTGRGMCRFSADVYDEQELVPWIRTFISRIVSISFTDKMLEENFKEDIRKMYQMYNREGGDSDAV